MKELETLLVRVNVDTFELGRAVKEVQQQMAKFRLPSPLLDPARRKEAAQLRRDLEALMSRRESLKDAFSTLLPEVRGLARGSRVRKELIGELSASMSSPFATEVTRREDRFMLDDVLDKEARFRVSQQNLFDIIEELKKLRDPIKDLKGKIRDIESILGNFPLELLPRPKHDKDKPLETKPRPLIGSSDETANTRLAATIEGLEDAGISDLKSVLADVEAKGSETAKALEEAYSEASQRIQSALGDVFKNGKFNFGQLEQAAIGSLDGILNKIFEILDQDLFKGFFGKLLGGGGGLFSDILGGVGGLLGLAGGGAVQPKMPVLVGERGPEIFVPPSVGSIVPNSRVGGGPPVTLNQTIRFDVGLESVDSRIAQAAAPIAAQAVAAIEEARERDFR